MNKKGTITSRTLEKLGWLRFRSHSQPDVEGKSQDQHESVDRTASVNTITGGELNITDKYHRRSLKERVLGYKQEEKQSTAKFYLDDTSPTMVTTATGAELGSSGSVHSPKQEKKKGKVQPEGTNEYIVKDSDTLEKIAAHFDTTPSELKKLNKLMTSAMIFSGQVLFVPDKEYEKSACSSLSMSDETNSQSSSVFGSVPDRPTMDTPLIKAVNSSPTRIPGHAERQTPVSSPKDLLEYEVMVPHKLTEDEAEQLDKDCMERFIKLNVKHITDGQGVVKGVLLVTPNAVMFDPDVSDPLVLEHGHEKYGMIAPMDLIISAAMYHDISAMKQRGKKRDDGTSYPRPEVYHDKSCPMAKQKLEESQQSSKGLNSIPERLQNILRNPLNKSDSVCSCGHGSMEVEFDDAPEVFDDVTKPSEDIGSASDALSKDSEAEHVPGISASDESRELEAGESVKVDVNKTGDSEVDLSAKEEASVHEVVVDSSLAGSSDNVDGRKSPDVKRNSKKLAVSFSVADPEAGSSDIGEITSALESGVDTTSETGRSEENAAQNSQVISNSADKDIAKDEQEPDKGGDTGANIEEDSNGTRIGNIVYLPVETDVNGEFTVKSLEVTKDTLSKLSAEEFKVQSKSDTNLADDGSKQMEKSSERVRSSSSSSLGPFSPTPHISAFVNYATGFFQKTVSDNNIKDISEANLDTTPLSALASSSKKDIPVVASAPLHGKRRGKISRHSNWADVEVESAVSLEEKGDLLTMDYDKFAPRKSMAYPDPPLYLCLRLGTPQNKNIHHNYPIESYGKRRKKSEYWFSIPREKVDHLYAFFVQWSPEIYGDEEDLTAEKRGFVVIEEGEEEDEEDLEMLDEHFGPNSAFQKDWEIISASEADKRKSTVFDEPLPLPDLIGESAILTEEHIECLVPEMPGRTIGYPWSLIYSTYKHGFSLKTLYRDMQGLESPILIVVKDTNDQVFGALTSEELKMSDHFYGTGETFLYSFYPEFQIYNWSGDNNFFLKGNQESLTIGAGQGVYGLWFDEDIYHGRTNRCETFNNDILTLTEDFVVKGFEAWAFV